LTYIRQQAARVLALEETELPDPRRPLNELGFDSLTAVEFCNRAGRAVGQHINPTLLFDYPTLEGLTGYILHDLLQMEVADQGIAEEEVEPEAEAKAEQAIEEVREQAMTEVEGMSEEDMDAAVAEELKRLQH
jgi:acyl carrier protein